MKNLFLIRHFTTEAPVQNAFYGSTDLKLKAHQEDPKLRESLKGLATFDLYSSPMLRCRETCEYFFPKQKSNHLENAVEVDFGDWEGKTFAEIEGQSPELVEAWQTDDNFSFPNGESLKDFNKRIAKLADLLANSPAENCVLVTHGGVIRHLICHYLGLSARQNYLFEVSTGSLNHLKVFSPESGSLAHLNITGEFSWLK